MDFALHAFLVDVDPALTSELVSALNARGYASRSFPCAREALEMARQGAPDLVVSSEMPCGQSGLDLAYGMKILSPGCRVLVLSDGDSEEDVSRGEQRLGAGLHLVPRPVSAEAIYEIFHKLD